VVEGDQLVQRSVGDRHCRQRQVLVVAPNLLLRSWTGIVLGAERLGASSFFLDKQKLTDIGIRRGIRYTWAFMLLGQIVAISFATNLFFLTLLVNPPMPAQTQSGAYRQKWLGPWLLNLFAIFATAYPAILLADEHYWHHPTAFMPVLLAPHVALMVLPLVRLVVPARYLAEDTQLTDKVYSYMWALVLGNAGLMLAWTTATAYSYGGVKGILYALHEHPAVSSVGSDVIFCWVSWICWYQTQSMRAEHSSKAHMDELDGVNTQNGSSTVLDASGYDSNVRRR
jgi:hypothetical protein